MKRKQLDFDYQNAEFIADPYPVYEAIREIGNVVWNDLLRGWVVVGYEECVSVLTDREGRFPTLLDDPDVSVFFEAPTMISIDGQEHRRLRGALYPRFVQSAIKEWEPRIVNVVDGLLAPLVANGALRLEELTMLPTVIMADMLGVPQKRYPDFTRWSNEINTNFSYGREDDASGEVLRRASAELREYITDEIERHKVEKPDDLLTFMLDLPEGVMTIEEIRDTSILLIIAGYDTTAKAISNSLLALEAHPEQRRLVASDPALVPQAIEEALRWNGPTQWGNPRRAVEDTVLDGQEVYAGDIVYTVSAAANRDPRRWDNPERFDILREQKKTIAFGHGPHFCIGAPLARLQAKVLAERLLRVAPEYRLRDLEFAKTIFFARGPDSGTVQVGDWAARQPEIGSAMTIG